MPDRTWPGRVFCSGRPLPAFQRPAARGGHRDCDRHTARPARDGGRAGSELCLHAAGRDPAECDRFFIRLCQHPPDGGAWLGLKIIAILVVTTVVAPGYRLVLA